MNAAAEAFSIRHVCGFGDDLPEGMASLDLALKNESSSARPVVQDGRKAALISFDVTTDGLRPVPRTHLNLIAGGLAIFLESRVPQGARLMSAFAPSSFAGVTSSLLLWLLSGGTLALHHPYDGEALERQINECACDTLVAPAAMALRLTDADMATRLPTMRHVIGLWRMPEQVASSALWTAEQARFTDVYLFGEVGLFGARRTADGAPVPIMPGPHGAPRDVPGTSIAGETLLTPKGTLALRGPMVTVAAYAPPAPSSDSSDGAPTCSRLRRHRLCSPPRPFLGGDLHHLASFGNCRRRRLPFPVAGSSGMGEAARARRASDGVARSALRVSSRRTGPGQRARPRGVKRTRA